MDRDLQVPGEDGRGIWRCVFLTHPEVNETELLDFAARYLPSPASCAEPCSEGDPHQPRRAPARRDHLSTRPRCSPVTPRVNNPLGGMGPQPVPARCAQLAERLGKIVRRGRHRRAVDQYDRQRRAVAEQYLQGQTIANKQTLEETRSGEARRAPGRMRAGRGSGACAQVPVLRTVMLEGLAAASSVPESGGPLACWFASRPHPGHRRLAPRPIKTSWAHAVTSRGMATGGTGHADRTNDADSGGGVPWRWGGLAISWNELRFHGIGGCGSRAPTKWRRLPAGKNMPRHRNAGADPAIPERRFRDP